MNSILIYFICLSISISSILVITSKNALHSIIFLISSFFFSSLTIFLLGSEFLALFFLIIYLGAIVVLFLFVVMMLDLKHNIINLNRLHLPVGSVIGALTFFYTIYVFKTNLFQSSSVKLTKYSFNYYINWYSMLDSSTDIDVISGLFYQNYVAQILIAGILLYVAVIGVVFLTSSKYKQSSFKSTQSLTRQLSRNNIL